MDDLKLKEKLLYKLIEHIDLAPKAKAISEERVSMDGEDRPDSEHDKEPMSKMDEDEEEDEEDLR